VESLLVHSRQILQGLKSLATKRSLIVNGQIGDIIEYSPMAHELAGGTD
jgi:hypothetical protein